MSMDELTVLLDKQAIKEVTDLFSTLDDEKAVAEQMKLLTDDAEITAYMGDSLYSSMRGKADIESTFTRLLGDFDGVYHLNGQLTLNRLTRDEAEGMLYCHVVLVEKQNDKTIIHNNYGRYEDSYVKRDGRWLLRKRTALFTVTDSREQEGAASE